MIEILLYALFAFVFAPYCIRTDGYRGGFIAGLKVMIYVHVIILVVAVIIIPGGFIIFLIKRMM